jgi:hypothetical protein
MLIDQDGAKPAHGRVPRDGGPGDAAADHQQVRRLGRQLRQSGAA